MKLRKIGKKGQLLNQFSSLAIGIAGVAIVLVVAFLITAQTRSQIGNLESVDCANFSTAAGGGGTSLACNATATLQSAAADLPAWIPIVIVAAVGLVLFGLVRLFQRGT